MGFRFDATRSRACTKDTRTPAVQIQAIFSTSLRQIDRSRDMGFASTPAPGNVDPDVDRLDDARLDDLDDLRSIAADDAENIRPGQQEALDVLTPLIASGASRTLPKRSSSPSSSDRRHGEDAPPTHRPEVCRGAMSNSGFGREGGAGCDARRLVAFYPAAEERPGSLSSGIRNGSPRPRERRAS